MPADRSKPQRRDEEHPDSEFERFERLTRKLVSVPKKEIEKQAPKRKKAG